MNVLYLVCYENRTPDVHGQFPGRFSYTEEIGLSYELVKLSLHCAALSRPAFSSLFFAVRKVSDRENPPMYPTFYILYISVMKTNIIIIASRNAHSETFEHLIRSWSILILRTCSVAVFTACQCSMYVLFPTEIKGLAVHSTIWTLILWR